MRWRGVEPRSQPWQGRILPFNYQRLIKLDKLFFKNVCRNGPGRIWTSDPRLVLASTESSWKGDIICGYELTARPPAREKFLRRELFKHCACLGSGEKVKPKEVKQSLQVVKDYPRGCFCELFALIYGVLGTVLRQKDETPKSKPKPIKKKATKWS